MYYQMYINGKWCDSVSKQKIPVENPATKTMIAEVPCSSIEDVDFAIQAANHAFYSWKNVRPQERAEHLKRLGKLISDSTNDFVKIITEELGMPVKYCKAFHIDGAVEEANYYADLISKYSFSRNTPYGSLLYEPYGVAAILTPWNYPLDQVTIKAFAAIAAGNCVVIKPSKSTPLSILKLAELVQQAGLPDGVFNVVTGRGTDLGQYLASHPKVHIFSFTGSSDVGKKLGAAAVGSSSKKTILELGGKSAMILLPDAEIEKATSDLIQSAILNSGQTCCAYTRVLVHRKDKRLFENILADKLSSLVIGDPQNPGTDIGPVINNEQLTRIKQYIQIGQREGASLVYERDLEFSDLTDGYYCSPVVFSDVTPDMQIAKEEIFGPVISIMTYDDFDQLIELANSTRYGLDGAIYGELHTAYRLAQSIDAGNIHINGAPYCIDMPFGGYKESGIGREGGLAGLEEYLQLKAVSM